MKFERLESIYVVITEGMRKECTWWPVMEIACRFIFVVIVVLSAGMKVSMQLATNY